LGQELASAQCAPLALALELEQFASQEQEPELEQELALALEHGPASALAPALGHLV